MKKIHCFYSSEGKFQTRFVKMSILCRFRVHAYLPTQTSTQSSTAEINILLNNQSGSRMVRLGRQGHYLCAFLTFHKGFIRLRQPDSTVREPRTDRGTRCAQVPQRRPGGRCLPSPPPRQAGTAMAMAMGTVPPSSTRSHQAMTVSCQSTAAGLPLPDLAAVPVPSAPLSNAHAFTRANAAHHPATLVIPLSIPPEQLTKPRCPPVPTATPNTEQHLSPHLPEEKLSKTVPNTCNPVLLRNDANCLFSLMVRKRTDQ